MQAMSFALPSENESAQRRLAGYQVRTRSLGDGQHAVHVDGGHVDNLFRATRHAGGYETAAGAKQPTKGRATRQAVVDYDVRTHGLAGPTPAHRAYLES